ncbi:MAG: SOS response-associated peptidase [Burkholderiaceae bacterium]|jgi:putative SOS response-associated peptidase YedK|nr:SOS response-associated peptidase [Burkholderiaceae bacterium]MBE0599741.1 SOS response-associated peptidase [Burkholderiaceae bacterium]
MTWAGFEEWTGIGPAAGIGPIPDGFNIKPTNMVPMLCRRPDTGDRAGVLARWGLIPHWQKGTAREFRASTFNARDDRLDVGMWRGFLKNRCVIPVAGYYEWKAEGKTKRPHFIYPAGNAPGLLFAGLWSKVRLDDFEGLTCTIITEAAAGAMCELHDRQPVMVPVEAVTDWLEGCSLPDLPRLGIEALAWHEVAAAVGRRQAEGPELVEPISSPS